jgi:hypothetical protein
MKAHYLIIGSVYVMRIGIRHRLHGDWMIGSDAYAAYRNVDGLPSLKNTHFIPLNA